MVLAMLTGAADAKATLDAESVRMVVLAGG
jgi:hypothetical protein